MEIIKLGKLPEEETWFGECKTCGSLAKAKHTEMNNITILYTGETKYSWEDCPVCKIGRMLFNPEIKKDE